MYPTDPVSRATGREYSCGQGPDKRQINAILAYFRTSCSFFDWLFARTLLSCRSRSSTRRECAASKTGAAPSPTTMQVAIAIKAQLAGNRTMATAASAAATTTRAGASQNFK